MKEYKIFASKYDSVEKMERNRESDYALELKTRTNFKMYTANSLMEAVEMFEHDNVCEELDNNAEYYIYYLDYDGSIKNVTYQ